MTADVQAKAYETTGALYMALELSNEKWRLAFSDGTRRRQVGIEVSRRARRAKTDRLDCFGNAPAPRTAASAGIFRIGCGQP